MKTRKYSPMRKVFAALLLSGVFLMFADSAFSAGVCTNVKTDTGELIPVGAIPEGVVTGDLNGDNLTDAVVYFIGSGYGSSFSILLNDGKGNLSVFRSIPVYFSIGDVGLSDFNLDGVMDLAVASYTTSGSSLTPLYVYFGEGNGDFGSPSINNFDGPGETLTIGDFNSDVFPDIAIANTGSGSVGTVTLFLNAGAGSFRLAGNFPVSAGPLDMEAADFDGDGKLDIVTANGANTGSFLRGDGTGSFQSATNFTLFTGGGSSVVRIKVGDLNNDSRPDLVVAGRYSRSLSVLINTGSGNFAAPRVTNLPNSDFQPQSIAVGQYAGDANLDVAVAVNISEDPEFGFSAAVILQGSGNGTFSPDLKIVPTGTLPFSIADGNFDGDSFTDLIISNRSSDDVSVLLNGGNNRYGPQSFPTNATPNQIVTADFNGDGNLDYAVSNGRLLSSTNPSGIIVFFGDGRGGVASRFSIASGATRELLARDVNKDGRTDLIATTILGLTNPVFVYINRSQGNVFSGETPDQSYSLTFPGKSIVSSDFNNDGNVDLVVKALFTNSAAILFGRNDGTFNQPSYIATPVTISSLSEPLSSATFVAGDFNNDNNSDLVFVGRGSDNQSGVFTLLGNGNGSFSPVFERLQINAPLSVITADFNRDGNLDVAVVNEAAIFGGIGTIVVAFGDGDGTFTQSNLYFIGLKPIVLATANINGDSFPDIIVANRVGNSLSFLVNNRNGIFRAGGNFLAGILPEGVTTGDFNNDGRIDFATANRVGNNFSVILNTCVESVTKTDYDGEGQTDFAVFRPSNGTFYVRNNDGGDESRAFGIEGDIPAPGDFDGDGRTDFAVFRPSNGTWYGVRSSNNLPFSVRWGTSGDVPAANDYDGDGRSDIAVFRPSNGSWYIIRSSQPVGFLALQFGQSGDVPVAADYDGDGRADIAVYRGGLWIIFQSSNLSVRFQQFGLASDKTVPGDYDGDGRADIAVYRGGIWYFLPSKTGTFYGVGFGLASDVPQPGDYDGDGKTDIAVFRPGDGRWYVLQSSNGQFRAAALGTSGDIPVSSIYRY